MSLRRMRWVLAMILALGLTMPGYEAAGQSHADIDTYMVLLEGPPIVIYKGDIPGLRGTAKYFTNSWKKHHRRAHVKDLVSKYKTHLIQKHDALLKDLFQEKSCTKLYSFTHILNGAAVRLTSQQADVLAKHPSVVHVQKSFKVQTTTVHTPEYLGLPTGIWSKMGGALGAGEDIVIGIVDTGIDPTHPSFSTVGQKPYVPLSKYRGTCEVAKEFPAGSCNGKLIGAQHFSAAASQDGAFNASLHFASPLDGDGHGSHVASTAAGNYGVPVILNNVTYGKASGMAPRARIAVYKALYRLIGGFIPDVIAACDKAVADGVDILSLSLGPNSPPGNSTSTFLNILDLALLNAVKANVLVVQAAGNGGPYPKTVTSFSPWVLSVAAGVDDRTYPNVITLGDKSVLKGTGLAPATKGEVLYPLILAKDATEGQGNPGFAPSDCQEPSIFQKALVTGKLLICTYGFNYIFGGSTLQQLVKTVEAVGAAGVVLVVESDGSGSKFDPVPLRIPAIALLSFADSANFLGYYEANTKRGQNGKALSFGATAKLGDGQVTVYTGQAQQVALFSSRGPDVRDFNFNDADVLKPNVMGPGFLIWGAWTPIAIDNAAYQGEHFAMISGTSMATPHVAGLSALLKAKYPAWSPAALSSAMVTTADVLDQQGRPIQSQQLSGGPTPLLQDATPFDMGGGALNINAAINPGLIFEAVYLDYIKFLCSANMSTPGEVLAATKTACPQAPGIPADLNTPSITFANLVGTKTVSRTVTNVMAAGETYTVTWTNPADVVLTASPTSFAIGTGLQNTQTVGFTLRATATSQTASFGRIIFKGSLGHTVHIPVSIGIKEP